jgi:hypothetical protein
MERGTLSVIRQGPAGPYYNHQCYEEGRHVSRYVPSQGARSGRPSRATIVSKSWRSSASNVVVEKALDYFVNHAERMQYGTFRRKGFFIGSGAVEAGCKTVIGARGKQSGLFWGEPGAENILAWRCLHSSRRLDEFWKERLYAHAARNDGLALTEEPKNSVLRPKLLSKLVSD